MRWQGFATGVVLMACGGVAIARPPQDAMEDRTVRPGMRRDMRSGRILAI
jgi:hypothetical protein